MIRDIFFNRHNHNLVFTVTVKWRYLLWYACYVRSDRFHLAQDAAKAALAQQQLNLSAKMDETVAYHNAYIRENGDDTWEVQKRKMGNINKYLLKG